MYLTNSFNCAVMDNKQAEVPSVRRILKRNIKYIHLAVPSFPNKGSLFDVFLENKSFKHLKYRSEMHSMINKTDFKGGRGLKYQQYEPP